MIERGIRRARAAAFFTLLSGAGLAGAQVDAERARLPAASIELAKRVQEVGDPSRARGHAIYEELLALGERLAPAVPEIAALLEDERAEVRCWGLSLAFALDWEAEPLLAPLQAALDEDDPDIQANAAAALGNLGRLARGSAARLEELSVRGEGEAATWSAWGLARVDPERALRHPDAAVRSAAVSALFESKTALDTDLVPCLVELLGDKDVELRSLAAIVLGNACPLLDSALRTRIGAAAHAALEREGAREWMVYVLGRVPERAESTVPALVRLARAGELRASVVSALDELGEQARPATAFLVEALADEDEAVRDAALGVLAHLDPTAPVVVEALRAGAERLDLRSTAWMLALRAAGEPVEPGALVTCLERGALLARVRALGVLGRMGTRALAARDAVQARLEDESEEVRLDAALALLRIDGSGAPELWGPIVAAATDDSTSTSTARLVLLEGAALRPDLRSLVRARLSAPSLRTRVRAAALLLELDPADGEALRGLLAAGDESGAVTYGLLRPGILEACFDAAGEAERTRLLDFLDTLGQGARPELGWLRTRAARAEPERARRIEATTRRIRGLERPQGPR